MQKKNGFTLPRFFSVTSLLGILIVVNLLFFLTRESSIFLIKSLGEEASASIAAGIITSVRDDLTLSLNKANRNVDHETPLSVQWTAKQELKNPDIAGVSVIDLSNTVLYTTYADKDRLGALPGATTPLPKMHDITSRLNYRDGLSFLHQPGPFDNILQTYIPVLNNDRDVLGIIKLDLNVGNQVSMTEQNLRLLWYAIIIILGLLYIALQLVIRHASGVIREQQEMINSRNKRLEFLSMKLLQAEEHERRTISEKLHEDIAQTLAALKLSIEQLTAKNGGIQDPEQKRAITEKVIPIVQHALEDVRNLAVEIRPVSIDDIGLLPTIQWLCRQHRVDHPETGIEVLFAIKETEIPPSLPIVIYRVIEHILDEISRNAFTGFVQIELHRYARKVALSVSYAFNPKFRNQTRLQSATSGLIKGTTAMRERILLSGGVLNILNQSDHVNYNVEWGL